MHYENLVDLHTHSDHSFDGKQSCMLLCETAVAKGASCIAITDHLTQRPRTFARCVPISM